MIADLTAHLDRSIIQRAAFIALILGTILTLSNQSGAIFGTAEFQPLPCLMVFSTPFVVVTLSQMLGASQAHTDMRVGNACRPDRRSFAATAFGHGIPTRAVLVGLAAGSANTAVIVSVSLFDPIGSSALPLPLLAQAFSLPVLFGVLSQTASYRRAINRQYRD